MKLRIEKSVTVITPTVGSQKLVDAIEGVSKQTYKNLTHLVVIDGNEYAEKAKSVISKKISYPFIKVLQLPYNTGANGFNGQRIYASVPHLVDSDYIFFLDEDNWYEPNHVQSLVDLIESENLDFAYSFRKIFDKDKNFVADDNCESLGQWPIWFTHDNPQYLVDTSSFAFKREFLNHASHLYHTGPWGEDRRFFYAVKDAVRNNTTHQHTMCYRLDGNPNSVNADFFAEGNKKQLEHYKGEFPWLKTS